LLANVAKAQASGSQATVVTFDGHPKQVLLGRAPRTLTTLQHRLALFRDLGIEHTLVLRFDEALRQTTADQFLRQILHQTLHAQGFVLGFDSKFGKDQVGSAEFLRAAGEDVDVVERVSIRDRAISSTAIREAVELGDIVAASAMLGRRVSVMGTVMRGDALGRTLGFPTANLNLNHELHPPSGVYAGFARRLVDQVEQPAGNAWPAMTNIGYRPSLAHSTAPAERVEVHLLGFSGDLYGAELEFEFVRRLREERAFPDLDALRAQIERDRADSHAALEGSTPDFGGARSESGPAC